MDCIRSEFKTQNDTQKRVPICVGTGCPSPLTLQRINSIPGLRSYVYSFAFDRYLVEPGWTISWKLVKCSKVKDMLVSLASGRTSKDMLQIFDVRDADFVGGNLITAENVPCHTFLSKLGHLYNEYHSRKEILIYTMHSQQIGASQCANWYIEGIKQLVNHYKNPYKKNLEYPMPFSSLNDVALSDELIENLSNQKVFVLKGGFHRILNKYAFRRRITKIFENLEFWMNQNEGGTQRQIGRGNQWQNRRSFFGNNR